MAARASSGEHAYVTIEKDMKEERIPDILILCGREQYLVKWAIDLLTKKYVEPASKEMDLFISEDPEITIDEIKSVCETLPILSPKKLVVLKDYVPVENERVIEYLEDLPESTILVLAYEKITEKSKTAAGKKNDERTGTSNRRSGRDILFKVVKSKGKIYDFGSLGRMQLAKFISKRLRGLGKEADPSLISMIIAESGYYNRDGYYTLYNIENDVKKMADHCPGSQLTVEDVIAGLSENLETNIFAMLDAVSGNRKDEAFRLLYDLILSGEKAPKLIAVTASQLELMLCIKEMRQEGKTRFQMEKEMNVHEYRLKKAMGFAEKYSERDLRRILHSVYETDGRIKTGFLEPQMALEMMIAEI